MRNPWIKKNPFMSMWLSTANAWMGVARGYTSAAAKRQMTKATKTQGAGKKKGRPRSF